MASDHTADPSVFNDVISMLTGADRQSATQLRAIYEKLHDNTAFLRGQTESLFLRQACTLRTKTHDLTDLIASLGACELVGAENTLSPVLAIKAGQAALLYDADNMPDFSGAIPNLTTIVDAAVSPSGTIVAVGATSPFGAYRDPGGSWTAVGSGITGTPSRVIYAPGYDGFLTFRTSQATVFRNTVPSTTWGTASSGLSTVKNIASIGGGPGAGRIVALQNDSAPGLTFSVSTNLAASFSVQATAPSYAALTEEQGDLASCPLVTRLGLNRYVYHVARCSGGTTLRTARSADGANWDDGPTISAPSGRTFSGTPRLLICKSTGLMAIVVSTTVASESISLAQLYTSRDFTEFAGASSRVSVGVGSFAIAGGRLLATENVSSACVIYASDGVAAASFGV